MASPSADDPLIGQRIGGVEVASVLRTGPLGPQYLAKTPRSGSMVVLHLLPDLLRHAEGDGPAEILEAARTAGRVREPEAAGPIKADHDGAHAYILCEHVPGRTAAEMGTLSVGAATRLAPGAAAALAKVHGSKLIHRDVRPENILLGDDGKVRLLGLGLTAAVEALQGLRLGLPLAGPAYCSPELYQQQEYTHRVDVYSLGAVYFHMLTGRPPFQAGTSMQVLHKHCTEPPPDPAEIDPAIPPACGDLIRRAMAKSADDRFRHAREMMEAFDALLAGLPAEVEPTAPIAAGLAAPELEEPELADEPAEPEPPPEPAAPPVIAASGAKRPSGVRSGVKSGVRSGVQSGVRSGVQSGVRSGVRAPVDAPRGGGSVVIRPAGRPNNGSTRAWAFAAAFIVVLVGVTVGLLMNRGSGKPKPKTELTKTDEPIDARPDDPPRLPDETPKILPEIVPAPPKFETDGEGFIRNWLLLAPIPNKHPDIGESLRHNTVPNEAGLKPKEGDRVRIETQDYVWRTIVFNDFGIRLHEHHGIERCAAYGVCYVLCDAEMKDVRLKIGTDDHGRAYLNGKEVIRHEGDRAVEKDHSASEPLTLQAGVNVLIVKVVNHGGDWGFCARFTDKDNRPLRNIRVRYVPPDPANPAPATSRP